MNFEQKNRTSVGAGLSVVPAMVELKYEKKTDKCVFYSILVQTLNRKPTFVQFGQQKSATTGEREPFQPAMKRVKREDVATPDPADDSDATVEVPVNDKIIKRDGSYGTIVEPFSKIWITTFDRAGCLTVESGTIVKLAICSDFYSGNITYKANEVKSADIKAITAPVFQKYFQNTPISTIPTIKNIPQPVDVNPKYYGRSFVLPLSDDTPVFKDVEICVDPEDRKRFFCTQKDTDQQFVGVNMDLGEGKTRNNMGVIYDGGDQKYFFKYAYKSDAWKCFGIDDVDMWAKSAGRLMFNAKCWYAFGSSKLDDVKCMRSNADVDDGAGGADYGYGAYGMDIDDIEDVATPVEEKVSDDIVASTGFVSSMSIDLAKTAEAAGIELSKDFIKKHYGPEGFYNYNPEFVNALNTGWRTRIARGEHGVTFNLTEMNDDVRPGFIRDTADKKVKFYGIFPVGDDRPYEQVRAEGGNLEQFLEENKLFPSTIYAVTE